ncbi:outer dense fiber protein 2-like [Myxocyprinus asiaticus]|uniref:outer dense fiber protein 2-like n=1 Tax=Myxocyprinus asiaticus TaxID=70543 RepID=UPI0022227347|nr:outer dense fiber protein 2-like [Myxocyprinus asiaticus]
MNYNQCDSSSRQKLLLKTLSAAESAAVQLLSFRDSLHNEITESSSSSDQRFSRQKSLLLEKLEVFRRLISSVQQQLKELQDEEVRLIDTEKQIKMLHEKIKQTESDNQNLRSSLIEKEKQVEELMTVQKRETEHTESVIQLSKSIEATRAHLQTQLHSKEGQNNRLTVQLRALERTIAHQRLELDELRLQIAFVSESSCQEKEALKKATRAQKHRAEKFEAAVERCYKQLREKDVQLTQRRAERNMWQKQQEKITEEKLQLDEQIHTLQNEMAVLTTELQRERDTANSASANLLNTLQKVTLENEELGRENASLKSSIADIEQKLQISQAALQEQNELAEESKHQTEQYQHQVAELKAEITELKIKLESLIQQTHDTREGRDVEIILAREDLEQRLQELQVYPELLVVTEQNLQHYQEDLRRSEQKCTQKTESIRQLQDTLNMQKENVKTSLEMKESVDENNSQLQQKLNHLQKRLEEVLCENRELIHRLTAQEDELHYSSRRLQQRSDECQTLNRQLEETLTDLKRQVCKVKEKACARENVLQNKLMQLEAEKTRREKELQQLRQSKLSSENQYEVRLRDLQLSLDQSESHKQSIQNYVDFLKNSYATMFEEVLTSAYVS